MLIIHHLSFMLVITLSVVAFPVCGWVVNLPPPAKCSIPEIIEHELYCFRFVVDSAKTSHQDCILSAFTQLERSKLMIQNFDSLVTQKINLEKKKLTCYTYVVLIKQMFDLEKILTQYANHQRFYPFSNLLIIFDLESEAKPEFHINNLRFIAQSSINVVWISFESFVNKSSQMILKRALTHETIYPSQKLFDEDILIDTLIKDEHQLIDIRVSLFNCPPLVVYVGKENQTKYDGVEYRCFHEIAKNWKRVFTKRDFSAKITDPWSTSRSDLVGNISDVTMCSVWLSESNNKMLGLTRYYDHQCTTFLVPKPVPITQASDIYMPLGYGVWAIFLLSLIGTALLLKGISFSGMILYHDRNYGRKFSSLSAGIIEVINIATSHGAPRFPDKLPIKILIVSWTCFVLLLGTGYTSGYTSLLTSPRYSKPIDTLVDFIDEGIIWGELGERPGIIREMRETGDPHYIELARRMLVEKSLTDRLKYLAIGNYARFVKVLSDSYITDTETFPEFASSLRLMKQCVYEYFTSFAFRHRSPLIKIFDRQIGRFVEMGLKQKWFYDVNMIHGDSNLMQNFFDASVNRPTELRAINFYTLIGAFYLLGFGLLMGLISFIIECNIKRPVRLRRRK